MKKLLIACVAVAGFCALGQVASADPYCGPYGGGYYRHRHGYYGGYYPYYGHRRVFVNTFFFAPPPPVVFSYCPPSRPAYYEGRVAPERQYREPAPREDYSK